MEIDHFYMIYPKTNCPSLESAMRLVDAGDETVRIWFVLEEITRTSNIFDFDEKQISENETLEEAFMNFKMRDPDSICVLSYSRYALNPMDILFMGANHLQEMSVSSIQDFGYPLDSIVRLI